MTTLAPKLVTGQVFVEGQPQDVTGFPIFVHHKGDFTSGTSRSLVTLLGEDGVTHRNVHVLAYDMLGVWPKSLHTWSEAGLWNLAEKDWRGFGALALAELAKRELREAYGRQVAREAELLRSRRSADALMGR